MINLLKPAKLKQPLSDAGQIDSQYKYWRIRICYSAMIGYTLFYFTRKSFTFAQPAMIEQMGFTFEQLGIFGTLFSLVYGVSKFAGGILSDRSNPRYFMAFGLILTGLANIAFGFSSSFFWWITFWILNAYFQGWGWAPCAKLLTYWYAKHERGKWWSIWSVAHNLGGALIPLLVAFILTQWVDWYWGMIVPGVICVLMGLFLMERLRDIPESLGLPCVEKYKPSPEQEIIKEDKEPLLEKETQVHTAKRILIEHVLKNKYVWLLSFAYFFVYLVRLAIHDWGVVYFTQVKGYTKFQASVPVSWFEFGGILGMVVAGWGSDLFFKGRRVPVMVFCSALLILAIVGFYYVPEGLYLLDQLLMGCMGFLIYGPQMLGGIAAAEFTHKTAAGTSVGFAGCFGYLGAAAAGWPLAKVIRFFGWNGFFVALIVACLVTTALLLPLWSVKSKAQRQERRRLRALKLEEAKS